MWSENVIMSEKAKNKKCRTANFRVISQDDAGIEKQQLDGAA